MQLSALWCCNGDYEGVNKEYTIKLQSLHRPSHKILAFAAAYHAHRMIIKILLHSRFSMTWFPRSITVSMLAQSDSLHVSLCGALEESLRSSAVVYRLHECGASSFTACKL